MKNFVILFFMISLFQNLNSQNVNLRIIQTENEYFPHLSTAIQVYDNSDEPILDLNEENFIITIDGKECDSINVMAYNSSGLGVNIMLCLDISGSMKGEPLNTMKNAVTKFINEMRPIDKLAIMGFADEPELISDFSNDKKYLSDKVNEIKVKGNYTALYYAGYKGLKKLVDLKEKTAKILIIMGDGKDEGKSQSYTEDDIINLALNEGIPAFNIGYTKIDKSHLQSLERISDKTNGKFYESPNDEDLDKQYAKLYRQILNIYLLNYQICGLQGDGDEHLNSISVFSNNSLQKNATNKFIAPAGVPAIDCGSSIIVIEEEPKSYIWYYISFGILLLLLIVLLIYFIKIRRKKNNGSEETNVNQGGEALPVDPTQIGGEVKPVIPPNDNTQLPIENTIIFTNFKDSTATSLIMKVTKGEHISETFELIKKGATIGRNPENDISLSNSPTVSSFHAEIIYDKGTFSIEDKGSTNGTFINGRKILVHSINNGENWKIGSCEGVFHIK